MFGEEVEWCHRFARHGWQVLMVPSVIVTHLGGQSTRAVPSKRDARCISRVCGCIRFCTVTLERGFLARSPASDFGYHLCAVAVGC
jgi:hypothetical protein